MIKHRIIIIILISLSASPLLSQKVADSTYWFYFTDKKDNGYSINAPEAFLSQRSIDRRAWQSLPIEESDLPLTQNYIDSLKSLGLKVKHASKWLNGVLLQSSDMELIDSLSRLHFIDTVPWYPRNDELYYPLPPFSTRFSEPLDAPPYYAYGESYEQVSQLNIHFLHEKGFTGKGVLVAVIDAGFDSFTELPAFREHILNEQIIASRNFVNPALDVFNSHTHGTNVSSLIISNWEDTLIGTAPDADIILALTENAASETRIEEFAWIEAAEWADSLGADIFNTSLGYTTFDDSMTNHTYADMDGKTIPISIANGMTAGKGIVSVVSAGNSGNDEWHYLGAPSDAIDVLSVGAVSNTGLIGGFSSRGPSYDHRIKPEVVSMGVQTLVQSTDGSARRGSGTSFAAPLIAGATATLWQAYPDLPASDLIRWIIEASDQYMNPDINYGYGIPDFIKAYHQITSIPEVSAFDIAYPYPNPFTNFINIDLEAEKQGQYTLKLYDIRGSLVYSREHEIPGRIDIPAQLGSGLYIMELQNDSFTFRNRLIKL